MQIAPSILSVLDQDIKKITKSLEQIGIKYLHLDVMDHRFVPNFTFDHTFIKTIRNDTKLIFDTHLMIEHPEDFLDAYLSSGSDLITFHIESTTKEEEIIDKIKKKNKQVGVSIKPKTKVESILHLLDKVDLVLVMSVEPGFGGQSFIEDVLEKVRFLKQYRKENHLNFFIEIDGGINNQTIRLAKEAGVDIAVVGTYFFKNPNLEETLRKLVQL